LAIACREAWPFPTIRTMRSNVRGLGTCTLASWYMPYHCDLPTVYIKQ